MIDRVKKVFIPTVVYIKKLKRMENARLDDSRPD
jgi:hypothetical protein